MMTPYHVRDIRGIWREATVPSHMPVRTAGGPWIAATLCVIQL